MHDQWSGINDSEDLNQKTEDDTLLADAAIGRQLGTLLKEMSGPKKMVIGLHAYWLTDTSHKQLCKLQPKHGEFSAEVNAALVLVRQLSPQSLAEVATEILVEDWDLGRDAPSATIE